MMFKHTSVLAVIVLACLSPQLHSQQTSADLSDVTTKFVRNMKFIESRIGEKELAELYSITYQHAEEVAEFFRKKNADSIRRDIRKYQEELKLNPSIKERQREKLAELNQELREADPEGNYSTAKKRFNDSSKELMEKLNLIQTTDDDYKQVIRITIDHIRRYKSVLALYPR
ncbi:MAG: hypothetical protein AAFY98_12060 [Verrucomicrobiota bacterium]